MPMDPATVQALEDQGFEKALTDEEWEAYNEQLAQSGRYGSSEVVVEYILVRGDVQVIVEQNTSRQTQLGVPTTVHYPEVCIVEVAGRRVACAADVRLILAMADALARPRLGGPIEEGEPRVRRRDAIERGL